jgi:hypothetical protein
MKSFLRHPAVLRAIAGFMLGLVMMVVFNPMAAHAGEVSTAITASLP